MNPKELINEENFKDFPFNYRNLEIHYLKGDERIQEVLLNNNKIQNKKAKFKNFYKPISRIL